MKYSAITDSVKQALGLPDADDARLLREINIIRQDICAYTDWQFLRRLIAQPYAAGSPVAVPGAGLGVRAVFGANSRLYFHGTAGMLPAGTGLRFWCWNVPTGQESFTRAISLYDENGTEVQSDNISIHFWTAPADLTAGTLSTTDFEFPGTAPFISGLHGRWLRYQELKPEQAGPFEQAYAADLNALAQRNPKGIAPPVFSRGGVLFSTSDRVIP